MGVNNMMNPTVVLIEKEGNEENARAEKMIDHLAYNYLVEPDIHFRTYKFSSEIDIDELKGLSLPQLPTFVILFHNEIAVFRYVYDEYNDKYVLTEDGVIDFINDYANTDLTNQGSRYPIPGRIPDVDKVLAKVKVFDRETISKIEEMVKKADRTFAKSKPVYLEVIELLKEKGMDAIWKRLSEKRELIRKVEAEEQMQDGEDDGEEEEEEEEEELNDLEDLIVYRNIIRSFAKDVPVDHFEEEELYCVCCDSSFNCVSTEDLSSTRVLTSFPSYSYSIFSPLALLYVYSESPFRQVQCDVLIVWYRYDPVSHGAM